MAHLFLSNVCVFVLALPSDGIRQHHWGDVSGVWQDFHKEIHHWNLHHHRREGESRQLHHHARSCHRGGVRTLTHTCTHLLIIFTLKCLFQNINYTYERILPRRHVGGLKLWCPCGSWFLLSVQTGRAEEFDEDYKENHELYLISTSVFRFFLSVLTHLHPK